MPQAHYQPPPLRIPGFLPRPKERGRVLLRLSPQKRIQSREGNPKARPRCAQLPGVLLPLPAVSTLLSSREPPAAPAHCRQLLLRPLFPHGVVSFLEYPLRATALEIGRSLPGAPVPSGRGESIVHLLEYPPQCDSSPPPASRQSSGKLYLCTLGLCIRPCPSLGSMRQSAPHAYSHLDPAHTGKPKSDSLLYPSALPWEPIGIGQELHDTFGAGLGPTKAHCSTEPSFTWAIRRSSRQRATRWPASPPCPCSSQPSQPPTFPGQLLVNRAQASGSPPSLLAPGITSPRHTCSVPSHCWGCSPLCPPCVWCCSTRRTLPGLASHCTLGHG